MQGSQKYLTLLQNEHTHCSAVKYFNKHNLQSRTWTHIKLESHKAAELNSPSRNVRREHARGLGLAVGGVHHDVEAGEEIQQFLRQGVAAAEEGGFAREAKIFLVTNINQCPLTTFDVEPHQRTRN